jgi:hypothetical protein
MLTTRLRYRIFDVRRFPESELVSFNLRIGEASAFLLVLSTTEFQAFTEDVAVLPTHPDATEYESAEPPLYRTTDRRWP